MSTSLAILESSASEWIQILFLVFGGCCSNVWALEAVLKNHPNSATLLTFAQFSYVTIQQLPSFVVFGSKQDGLHRWMPRLKKRQVPLRRWTIQVVMFLAISLLNNYAFTLKIPITLHIIFRSGGLCVSMLTGYLYGGKRYSFGQVAAGIIITSGITIATLSSPSRSTRAKDGISTSSASSILQSPLEFAAGILSLTIALFVSALLGLFQEKTYEKYGKAWKEGLFYSHFLSIPCFIPLYPTISTTFSSYISSAPVALFAIPEPAYQLFSNKSRTSKSARYASIPSAILALGLNVFTQGLCITGVNRLTSRVSSTTVNLILTVRKAVSLWISVWYYGSGVSTGLLIGGVMVLGGTIIYTLSPSPAAIEPRLKAGDMQTNRRITEVTRSNVEIHPPSDQSLRKRK